MVSSGVSATKIMMAGGGTGGHVFPGIAVAEEIRRQEPDALVLFVGAPGGIEEKLVPAAGWELKLVRSVKATGLTGYLRLPFAMLVAVRAAGRLIDEFQPQVVVALGGYASCPPALAAWRRGLPVVVLEQNAIPGRVSRFLSRFAAEVHATYDESVSALKHPERVEVTGNPVRRSIVEAASGASGGDSREHLGLLVAGGSQGARRLNEIFGEAAQRLGDLAGRLSVVHLAGSANYRAVQEAAKGLDLPIEVVAFEDDMARRYLQADVVLSRAGATALAEISVCGLPALLVPYPHAKDNHQEANASSFERAGAARILREATLDGETLAGEIRELVENPDVRMRMAERMRSRARPEAGERIAGRLLAIAAGRAAL
jgi:UDP-N-acetylglucosamine--N-acetylmuramyl-(pentapeptide) pyrophosphoryl-undecaprenol N-acetylglucosamine transferase